MGQFVQFEINLFKQGRILSVNFTYHDKVEGFNFKLSQFNTIIFLNCCPPLNNPFTFLQSHNLKLSQLTLQGLISVLVNPDIFFKLFDTFFWQNANKNFVLLFNNILKNHGADLK